MKKIIGITIIVLLCTVTMHAQRGQRGGVSKGADLTIEQKVALQTKRMALNLDLNAKQQQEVEEMLLKNAEETEALRDTYREKKQNGTLTADEKFDFENNRIERQAAHKAAMKKILNADQYQKWETMFQNRGVNKNAQNFKGTNKQKGYNNRS